MTNTKNTAAAKFDAVAGDFRVASIRPATFEESEGEAGWIVVTLIESCTVEGLGSFVSCGVADARRILRTAELAE